MHPALQPAKITTVLRVPIDLIENATTVLLVPLVLLKKTKALADQLALQPDLRPAQRLLEPFRDEPFYFSRQ